MTMWSRRPLFLLYLATTSTVCLTSVGQHISSPPDPDLTVDGLSEAVDSDHCPDLLLDVFPSHFPVGGVNTTTMNYTKVKEVETGVGCVQQCCDTAWCQAAFVLVNNATMDCFMVACATDQLCLPRNVSHVDKYRGHATMVLVRPQESPWTLPADTSNDRVCEVGLDDKVCRANETCRSVQQKSRNGVCRCADGLTYADDGVTCVVPGTTADLSSTTTAATTTTTLAPVASLAVSVASKTVTLPVNAEHLTAYSVPEDSEDNPYKYEWKLVSGKKTGSMKDSSTQTLQLSGLEEGIYQFSVTVTSPATATTGQAFANVTVLKEKRINKPPTAVVTPRAQTVNLPTNVAIIDGSSSTDDSGSIASYSWTLDTFPLGYQANLVDDATLSLKNLQEGNYTLSLTVTDGDGATDKATATVIVLAEMDYPPNANAGEDVIIYYPRSEVTLNGNKSVDDHGIVSWEWTKEKTSDGQELTADITGARTPYLTASHLEQGVYNFLLRVTDSKGQTAEDRVTVYVKPASNLAPVAKAGNTQTVSLPVPYVTLDGSGSNDDVGLTSYRWSVVTEPRPPVSDSDAGGGGGAVLATPGAAVTNVTNLTVGEYTFRLTVTDGSNNTGTDTVQVIVKQDTNAAPVAHAGDDRRVSLPVGVVRLDGRGSSDDLGVARWSWTRDLASLAAGTVVGNSSQTSVLVLADLVPGRYVFNLQVWDAQGKTSQDSVSIIVEKDPDLLSVVELVVGEDITKITHKQVMDMLERLRVVIHGEGSVSVLKEKLYGARATGLASLRFKVLDQKSGSPSPVAVPGLAVVRQLKRELEADPELLGLRLVRVETVVCQNQCSGHGDCDQETRQCRCQPFWMENPLSVRIMGAEPNCDWSIVYVCLSFGLTMLVLLAVCCLCSFRRRAPKRVRSPKRYSRLGTNDAALEMEGEFQTSLIQSETDSDDEVLFESTKKRKKLNGAIPRRNGLVKNGKPKLGEKLT